MNQSPSNKAIVLAFMERVVGGAHYEEIPSFISESYADHNAPADAPKGWAGMEGHLRALRSTFPDFQIQVHEMVAEGNWVACRVTAEGTHLGAWQGIKPTGKRIYLRGINFDRLANGRIVEHWGEADTMGMLMQMGVNPSGPPSAHNDG